MAKRRTSPDASTTFPLRAILYPHAACSCLSRVIGPVPLGPSLVGLTPRNIFQPTAKVKEDLFIRMQGNLCTTVDIGGRASVPGPSLAHLLVRALATSKTGWGSRSTRHSPRSSLKAARP